MAAAVDRRCRQYPSLVDRALQQLAEHAAKQAQRKHSGVLAGIDPRVQPAHYKQHSHDGGTTVRKSKSTNLSSEPARPPAEVKQKGHLLEEYNKAWGVRCLTTRLSLSCSDVMLLEG